MQFKPAPTTRLPISSTSIIGVGLWATVIQLPALSAPVALNDAYTNSSETLPSALGEAAGLEADESLFELRSQLNHPAFTLLTDATDAAGDRPTASTTLTVTLDHAEAEEPTASALFSAADQALEPDAPFSFTAAPDPVPGVLPSATVLPTAVPPTAGLDSQPEAIAIPTPTPSPAAVVAANRTPQSSLTYDPTDAFQFRPPTPQPVEIVATGTAPIPDWMNPGTAPSDPVPVEAAPGSYLAPNAPDALTASTPFTFTPPPSVPGSSPGSSQYQAIAPTPSTLPPGSSPVIVIVVPPGGDLSTLPPWLTESVRAASSATVPWANGAPLSTSSSDLVGQSPTPPLQPVPSAPVPIQTSDPGPLTPPSAQFQGAVVLLDDDLSARARLTAVYPVTPELLFGGSFEITEGEIFADSELEGANINELYLTYALRSVPNLRFTLGQLDLTSYFDRNSFAKDALTHFINPVFQTNPALAVNAIGSRVGGLVNYSVTDNVELRAAVFSSDRSISEFELDAFAGEVGLRFGNAIVRGTYVSARDGGSDDGPGEIFGFLRDDGTLGIDEDDREEAFGVNAEVFIPGINMGLFGRYGRQENLDADFVADTFSGGFNFLDVFILDDRLGLAYGRALSNNDERRDRGDEIPDVLEFFYDFPITPFLRAGFTLQQLNEFTETVAGFRIRTDLDVTP
ncbi:MAG: porin [Elainellaceae cyanobacterium]